jgi:signal transduction histidine kinase
MSFAPVRKDFFGTRLRFALPLFLILWLAIILFVVVVSLFVKHQLETDEIRDVGNRLAGYLKVNPISVLSFDFSGRRGESGGLQGLAFIRLVRNGEQILLAESSSEQVDFQRLAALDWKISGVWISLADPKKHGAWTIVSKKLADGISIQAGKDSQRSADLYNRLITLRRWAASLGGLLALGLTFFCAKLSTSPIKKIHADIAAILDDGRVGMLLPEDREPVLVDLYGQFNRLLEQNRQLVVEMQASLDNVAHDLRTPMTRLRAVAEYGLQADTDTQRLKDALSDCLEESERVLSMLRIMMSVAEAESGTMHLQKEPVDLAASLADVVSLYEYVAEEKMMEITTRLQEDLLVEADRTRMAQVWANLLDNGIKYGKKGGKVEISSEISGEDAVVVFADDGIGISINEIHRIWDRLYRGDRSRSQPGLGLGLNYVKAVVEAHGGTVGVDSELQRGTRFTVRLRLST